MFKRITDGLISFIAIIVCIFEITVLIFYPTTPAIVRGVHILLVNTIVLLGHIRKEKILFHQWISFVFLFLNIVVFLYAIFYLDDVVFRGGMLATNLDLFIAATALITVLYVTWRAIGNALPIISITFVLYALLGNNLPDFLGHRGYSYQRILVNIYSFNGIFGLPLGVASTILAMFLIFGQVFQKSGVGDFFMELANSLTKKSRGGAAKTAVLASALFGTISGSAVVNVSATGTMTIPMMKKLGYSPLFAGAVEAVASTGGQLMPPIMASAAFLMAEILGIPYREIAKSAIIPALIYFTTVWFIVDLRSDKIGLKPVEIETKSIINILKSKFILLLPLIVLVYTLFGLKFTPIRAAFFAMIASVVIMFLFKPDSLISKVKIIGEALTDSGISMGRVSPATATAGTIAGLIGITGLGTKISGLVVRMAGDQMFIGLIASMFVALIFGMGMPTTISYILCVCILAPSLVSLGITPVAAHFFILYFAILSNITPPVAMAAFTAGGISGADPIQTAKEAVKMSLPIFILPYVFVYDTSMLLIDFTPFGLIRTILAAIIAVASIGFAMEGWLGSGSITFWIRGLFLLGAISLLIPILIYNIIGLLIFGITLMLTLTMRKKTIHFKKGE